MAGEPENQRIARLTPLADVLAWIASLVAPVVPREVALDAALLRVLAEDVRVDTGLPAEPRALRDGYAVRAEDIADAGPYTPMPFVVAPTRVDVGDALPPDADAVAPLDALVDRGGNFQAVAPTVAGEGVLPACADLRAGDFIACAGWRLNDFNLAMLAATGRDRVPVREPRIRLLKSRPASDVMLDAVGDLLSRALAARGCAVSRTAGDLAEALAGQASDAVIAIGGTGSGRNDASISKLAQVGRVEAHGVAISPGETAAFGMSGARPVLLLPGRIDAAIAGWLTMGLPMIDRLAGSSDAADPFVVATLARKVASPLGLVEVVPVRLAAGQSGAHSLGLLAAGIARRFRRLDAGARRQRRFSSRNRGHGKTLAMNERFDTASTTDIDKLFAAIRRAARQEQFLEVVSAEEARARFARHVSFAPLEGEHVALSAALGRVLAHDVAAPIDVPPFDRSNVDGFAVRAADTAGAADTAPRRLRLNGEVVTCGHAPVLDVGAGTATTIATGGVVPRGADAVVMVEHTDVIETDAEPAIHVRRAAAPGQFISYAGSDIAHGEVLLRRGARIGSREIGMLAACGIAEVEVVRRPRVAVLSTGDELTPPGQPLRPAAVYDLNGAIVAAAVAEAGGEPVPFGSFPDDEIALELAIRAALATCDMVLLSGGTSKGAGDLSHRVVSRLGEPGVIVHGVALKPGKPLCLAVVEGKPLAVLPGFPTSAIFTFHAFVAPLIRAQAGLPPEAARTVMTEVSVFIPSELGRQEFVLVALVAGGEGPVAFPTAKGSGSVTSFSQADGFLEIDALASSLDAGTRANVTLIGQAAAMPDLVVMGSNDIALDIVVGALAEQGMTSRVIAVGSLGGVAAAERGECDLAPVHLIDPASGTYNKHLLKPDLALVKGWQRMQGFVYRKGDTRFEGRAAAEAVQVALADADCLMVNRNAGAGTRVLIDKLLGGKRPPGYSNQPRSHNAVAAAIAQKRADWGVAIAPMAELYNLGFLPVAPEEYDFLVVESRRERPAVQAFLTALKEERVRAKIRALGMRPADA